ncbi:MAG TPA: hypothetical protein HA230_01565 [Candidatus Aenigmarchaeota archaeon]|nr:hypothetical protein [Candidatus Aenigmarchaeota archaeon]
METADIKRTQRKVNRFKKKVIIPVLVVLTGIFVFTTADLTKEVMTMFFGSVAGFSLLTIIFFVANMTKEQTLKDAIKPYAIVFGLLLLWILIFAGLRLVWQF